MEENKTYKIIKEIVGDNWEKQLQKKGFEVRLHKNYLLVDPLNSLVDLFWYFSAIYIEYYSPTNKYVLSLKRVGITTKLLCSADNFNDCFSQLYDKYDDIIKDYVVPDIVNWKLGWYLDADPHVFTYRSKKYNYPKKISSNIITKTISSLLLNFRQKVFFFDGLVDSDNIFTPIPKRLTIIDRVIILYFNDCHKQCIEIYTYPYVRCSLSVNLNNEGFSRLIDYVSNFIG